MCKSVSYLVFASFFSVISGCATSLSEKQDRNQSPDDLVAQNLVHAFAQLVSPEQVVLTLNRTLFSQQIGRALLKAGYAVRHDPGTQHQYTDWVSVEEQTHNGRHSYSMRYKNLTLSRRYHIANTAYPISPLYVSGVDTAVIDLNDVLFSASDKSGFVSALVMGESENFRTVE